MTRSTAGGPPARTIARRAAAGLTAVALTAGGLVAVGVAAAPAAQAATVPISGAEFRWGINHEVNAGAFAPGTWNLMSAGTIGNPGAGGKTLTTADSGATWSNGAAAGWKATSGNVTIEDKQADGSYAPTTFQGTRTNSQGLPTSGASTTILAETELVVANGTGTLDPAADNAQISWDGDATVLFYSGMTYFHLSDPTLSVVGGAATLRATLGGYATSMADSTQWTALPETTVTLATASGVDVTTTGIAAASDYLGVSYAAPSGAAAQNRTAATWGAFPQAFVDFQQDLGSGPYWYSTGGSADPRKPAEPFSVSYGPQVTVSRTTLLPSGAYDVTVTGSGFDPAQVQASRPPLAGSSGGIYVAFGKFADTWQPSTGATSTTRVAGSVKWAVLAQDMATVGGTAGGAVELRPDGTFTTTLTVDKAAVDARATAAGLTNYGVYTYPGGGASNALYETRTPIAFARGASAATLGAATSTYGAPASVTATVTGEATATGQVTLTEGTTTLATATLSGGRATFALPAALAAGAHQLRVGYPGDANLTASSAAATLTVARATSTSTAKVTIRKVTTRKRATLVGAVASVPGAATGPVTVTITKGGTTVRTVRATLRADGTWKVRLPRLAKAGTYRLVAAFAGTGDVAGSTSPSVTLKVTKAPRKKQK